MSKTEIEVHLQDDSGRTTVYTQPPATAREESDKTVYAVHIKQSTHFRPDFQPETITSEEIIAKKQRSVSIKNTTGVGHTTEVIDLATGERISNAYRVSFDASVDSLCEATIYTHLALLDYEGKADIVGVSHEAIIDAIRQTLTDEGISEQRQDELVSRILSLIFEQVKA